MTTRPRLLLTDADRFPVDGEDREAIRRAGAVLAELAGHDPDRLVAASRDAAAILVYHARFPAEVVARLGGCRVLARCGAGYDNIDVAAARRHGIEVTYVPDYGSVDVAEHTIALLLACARRLGASDRSVRAGRFPGYAELGAMRRLAGQTLGLLGFGRIAQHVARLAQCLGLLVLAHDPFADPGAFAAAGVRPVGRDQLLATADVLSLHLPLTEATRHTLDAAALARMKPTAILVNTARGALVDQAALVEALDAGRLAGAGLDVFDPSPPSPDDPLLALDTVVLSPHSAAFTEEALAEVRRRAIADALRVLRGEPPHDPVPEAP